MNENENNPFKILNEDQSSVKELNADSVNGDTVERIKSIISSDNVVLFMKGNANFPQCGFSANSVAILKSLGKKFTTFDILQDMDIRQGLKEFSNWPTFPQLYVKGQLVGGNDIITEMYQEGELQELLAEV
jgi:monothiol glutaredoxin